MPGSGGLPPFGASRHLPPKWGGTPSSIDSPDEFAHRFLISRETLGRLNLYESLLRRWQPAVNLVAPGTLDHIWHRHFADSAQLAALVPEGAESLADLGSGAGFPGLVLAILLSGKTLTRVILVESAERKAAFLREVARQTGTAVEILSTRIEKPETQARIGHVDVVCARALAPLDRLLELAFPLFGPGTVGLFPKGREREAEVEAARTRWSFDDIAVPSVTDAHAGIVVVRHLGARDKLRTEG